MLLSFTGESSHTALNVLWSVHGYHISMVWSVMARSDRDRNFATLRRPVLWEEGNSGGVGPAATLGELHGNVLLSSSLSFLLMVLTKKEVLLWDLHAPPWFLSVEPDPPMALEPSPREQVNNDQGLLSG